MSLRVSDGDEDISGVVAGAVAEFSATALASDVVAQAYRVVEWGVDRFGEGLVAATSLQDAVLIHLMSEVAPGVGIFSIDTGRLPEESYWFADQVRRQLGVGIRWYFPKHEAVEELVSSRGLHSFREGVAERRECCHIRKVEPLGRALAGADGWVTGLRREESVTRQQLELVEIDEAHGSIVKLNPLAGWSQGDIAAYESRHGLPRHPLMQQGYASIGCAPCTRAVAAGEDQRAGRWWWESAEHKECGLHLRKGV